jgi:hypothetical protein
MFLLSRAQLMDVAETSPPSVRQLSRECGILNISQSYRPPQPVTGIALHVYMWIMFVPHSKHMPPLSVTGIDLHVYM